MIAADAQQLADQLDPIAAELSRIAPEVRPLYAPFGKKLQSFAGRLREFSQNLLRGDTAGAARSISVDLLYAFVLDQGSAVDRG